MALISSGLYIAELYGSSSSVECLYTTYLEGYLRYTSWTFDVESENLQTKIVFIHYVLLSRVELLTLVDIFFAHITSKKGREKYVRFTNIKDYLSYIYNVTAIPCDFDIIF